VSWRSRHRSGTLSTRTRCEPGWRRSGRPAGWRWSGASPRSFSTALALAEALAQSFRWDRLHLVLAVSANKDVLGVVAPLAAIADVVYAAKNDSVRSADTQEIMAAARQVEVADVQAFASVAEAIAAARAAAAPSDMVLITGSLFTVADATRALATR
jgi:dihydrofolate synthase/folylpolyglutamate synthase